MPFCSFFFCYCWCVCIYIFSCSFRVQGSFCKMVHLLYVAVCDFGVLCIYTFYGQLYFFRHADQVIVVLSEKAKGWERMFIVKFSVGEGKIRKIYWQQAKLSLVWGFLCWQHCIEVLWRTMKMLCRWKITKPTLLYYEIQARGLYNVCVSCHVALLKHGKLHPIKLFRFATVAFFRYKRTSQTCS